MDAKVLMRDPNIREFLAILEASGAGRLEFISMMSHISAMERQLDEAARELTAMRKEIAGLRTENDYPIRTALIKAEGHLEHGVAEARARLDEIKVAVLECVKKALSAIKEQGIGGLNKTMDFLGVRKKLAGIRDHVDKNIGAADRAIAKIETVSAEYHETGRHLRNIGRALTGKEILGEAKPMGNIAKAARLPFKGARTALSGVSKSAVAAIGKLDHLEKAARSSTLGAIRAHRSQKDAAPTGMALNRTKSKEASL